MINSRPGLWFEAGGLPNFVGFVLIGIAFLASYIPARRATQIDTSQALREQ